MNIQDTIGKILDEYNTKHDAKGRFTGSGGSTSADYLSKDEINKINAVVDIKASMVSKEKTRIKLVADMTSSTEGKMVSRWAEYWCVDTRSKEALQQVIIRNRLTGVSDTHGMTRIQMEALNNFKAHAQQNPKFQKLGYDFEITPQQLKAGAIYQHYNQEVFRNNLAVTGKTEMIVYRGVHSQYSGEINKLASSNKDSTVKITTSSLSSFTADEKVAKRFMNGFYKTPTTDDRSLLRTTIKPENVWDSHYSSKSLSQVHGQGYDEIVTMDGKKNQLVVKVEASKFESMFK